MRYISIFSGIEAATVAWERLGWTPVAFAEIDAFPSAVLATRYPNVPNLGDVTKVDWSPYRGAVDLVVGGSPCQSFSVAGKREGLSGASGLMWEYIRCVQDVMPSWFIWENVPGAFNSERGWAFVENQQRQVRYFGGDGSLVGALSSQPGATQQTYVLASLQSNTEIEDDGMCPTITARSKKDPPVMVMEVDDGQGG